MRDVAVGSISESKSLADFREASAASIMRRILLRFSDIFYLVRFLFTFRTQFVYYFFTVLSRNSKVDVFQVRFVNIEFGQGFFEFGELNGEVLSEVNPNGEVSFGEKMEFPRSFKVANLQDLQVELSFKIFGRFQEQDQGVLLDELFVDFCGCYAQIHLGSGDVHHNQWQTFQSGSRAGDKAQFVDCVKLGAAVFKFNADVCNGWIGFQRGPHRMEEIAIDVQSFEVAVLFQKRFFVFHRTEGE